MSLNSLHRNAPAGQVGLSVTRAHTALAEKHAAMEKELREYQVDDNVAIVAKALWDFEEFSRKDRERLLQGGLVQSSGDQAIAEWLSVRYEHLSRLARALVPVQTNERSFSTALDPATWGLAMLLCGHSSKWRKMANQPADTKARARLHKLFRTALAAGLESKTFSASVDRWFVETSVEALYARALLLERFASGNLTPRRMEILDTWILTWMDALWLKREAEAGAALCVDSGDPNGGLKRHAPGERADFFLALSPLKRQFERAIKEFHRGVIFPGWGIGLSFRVEEHIAVINFLEREFKLIEQDNASKSKRFPIGKNSEVQVFAGFNDIYAKALSGQSVLTTASANSVASVGVMGHDTRWGGQSDTGRQAALNVANRPVHLLDISETGMGIEMSSEDAAPLEVDELIALQIGGSRISVLGVVARKAGGRSRFFVNVGIRVLAKVPLRAALEEVTDQIQRISAKGIFVPGAAPDGSDDSIIVPNAAYRASTRLSCIVAKGLFNIKLGHVRHQGPGWRLVAMEVVAAR